MLAYRPDRIRRPPYPTLAHPSFGGLAPGRAPQILSSSRAHTTTQYRGTLILRGRARLVVQTGSVALPTRRSPTLELSVPVVTAELRLDLLVKINSELPGENGSRNHDFGKISAKIIGSAVAQTFAHGSPQSP